jgi:hypothetical protein
MIFGTQMYHEEMQVKNEYGCDPIIIEGVIALGLRKRLENEFSFIFSLIVRWISWHSIWFSSDGSFSFYIFFSRISNFFDLSITEET